MRVRGGVRCWMGFRIFTIGRTHKRRVQFLTFMEAAFLHVVLVWAV